MARFFSYQQNNDLRQKTSFWVRFFHTAHTYRILFFSSVMMLLAISSFSACTSGDTKATQDLPENIVTADELIWQGVQPGVTTVNEMIALLGEPDASYELESSGTNLSVYDYYDGWQCIAYPGDPQLIRSILIGPAESGTLPPITRDIKIGDHFDAVLDKFPHEEQSTATDSAVTILYGGNNTASNGMLIVNSSNGVDVKELVFTAAGQASLVIDFDVEDRVESIQINNDGTSVSSQTENTSQRDPQEGLYAPQAKIYFRTGETVEGSILLTNSDMEGFYTVCDEVEKQYGIIFVFTEEGSQILAETTKERIGEKISIWIGEECLASPTIFAAIMDGQCEVYGGKLDEQNLATWIDKLLGK